MESLSVAKYSFRAPTAKQTNDQLSRRQRLVGLGVMAAFACAIVVSRRPDAFSNPQFYAEDGAVWFSDAYNDGPWRALWVSYQGHFLLQPRLVALIAFPFGARNGPLIYNIAGLLFQIAPVLFLMSNRFEAIVPSLRWRAVIALVYLLVPSTEMNVSIATAQFHLGILATLILVTPESRRWYWKAFDTFAIALCALTGAYVYILLPVALLWLGLRRWRWTAVLTAILGLGLAAQLYALTLAPRNQFGLGASLHDLILIVSDRLLLSGLFAEEGHTHVFLAGSPHGTLIAAGVCLLALAIAAYVAIRAPWELRVFALVAAGFAAAGLAAPLVSTSGNQWDLMVTGRAGERYFFMFQVAWVVMLLWAAARLHRRLIRLGAWALISAAFASGLIAAWFYPQFTDYGWPAAADRIMNAPRGARVVVTTPPGPPWAVDVTAK